MNESLNGGRSLGTSRTEKNLLHTGALLGSNKRQISPSAVSKHFGNRAFEHESPQRKFHFEEPVSGSDEVLTEMGDN
jgi:hypothetical protein